MCYIYLNTEFSQISKNLTSLCTSWPNQQYPKSDVTKQVIINATLILLELLICYRKPKKKLYVLSNNKYYKRFRSADTDF